MVCPYCGKRTNDIPTHLSKNENCHNKHTESLKTEFVKIQKNNSSKDLKDLIDEAVDNCRKALTGEGNSYESGIPSVEKDN